MSDTLTKFMFDDATVRGELVELTNSWQQILQHHDYPTSVRNLLGELCSAAPLLFANLKFEGTMVMQIHGDGPIKLLVVECNDQLQVRAMAKLGTGPFDTQIDHDLQNLINRHGKGRFIITLDPADKSAGQQPYQGIVPIVGNTIAAIIENYMHLSEQLDTKLWLACDDKVCRGMLLQRLPHFGGKLTEGQHSQEGQQDAQQAWERAAILGNTLKREELLEADCATLMHRLFWEENLRVFEAQHITFSCSCSREKVGNMLVMLGQQEVNEALAAIGKLDVNCDFCGKPYSFDAVDCAALFMAPENTLPADHLLKH